MHAMAGDVPQPPADEFDPYEYLDRYKRSDATGNPFFIDDECTDHMQLLLPTQIAPQQQASCQELSDAPSPLEPLEKISATQLDELFSTGQAAKSVAKDPEDLSDDNCFLPFSALDSLNLEIPPTLREFLVESFKDKAPTAASAEAAVKLVAYISMLQKATAQLRENLSKIAQPPTPQIDLENSAATSYVEAPVPQSFIPQFGDGTQILESGLVIPYQISVQPAAYQEKRVPKKRHNYYNQPFWPCTCDTCGKVLLHQQSLIDHQVLCKPRISAKIPIAEKKCNVCGHILSRQDNMLRHHQKCENRRCTQCNYVASSWQDAERHEEMHKNPNARRCSYSGCFFLYDKRIAFVTHRRAKHAVSLCTGKTPPTSPALSFGHVIASPWPQ